MEERSGRAPVSRGPGSFIHRRSWRAGEGSGLPELSELERSHLLLSASPPGLGGHDTRFSLYWVLTHASQSAKQVTYISARASPAAIGGGYDVSHLISEVTETQRDQVSCPAKKLHRKNEEWKPSHLTLLLWEGLCLRDRRENSTHFLSLPIKDPAVPLYSFLSSSLLDKAWKQMPPQPRKPGSWFILLMVLFISSFASMFSECLD